MNYERTDTQVSPYRWVILVTFWLTYFMVQLVRLNIGPIGPFLKESLNVSNTEIGLLVTAAGITYIPTLAIAGMVADHIGIRKTVVFGAAFGGIMILPIFFCQSYLLMFILLLVSGIGFGCIFSNAIKGILMWFPANERATALGINQTAINAAGIFGAMIFPLISRTIGWQYCFFIGGLSILIIGITCGFLYRDPYIFKPSSSSIPSTGISFKQTLCIFNNRNIWFLALGTLFMFTIELAVITNMVIYLTENLFFDIFAAGTLLALTQLGGAINKPLSGIISDRLIGHRRKPVYLTMCITATILCILLTFGIGQESWLIYPIFTILGSVTNGAGGIYTAMAGELIPRYQAGSAIGLCTAVAALGTLIGPPLFGLIVDSTSSFQLAWLTLAACGLISVILVSLVKESGDTG
jgi:MFS transporter, ACS family, hexuronate transporter